MSRHLTDTEFIELLTSAQLRLRTYALTLLPNSNDADDVVQSASIALWKKRAAYDPDRSFLAWASGYVLTEVLRLRRKKATDKLIFGEALLSTLAVEYTLQSREIDERRALLHHCMQKLSPEDQRLLRERYMASTKVSQIAEARGVPTSTLYSALARIREALYVCIQTNLAQDRHTKLT